MKCDKCDKDAVFQASMFLDGENVEVHLCEDHYKEMMQNLSEGLMNLTNGKFDINGLLDKYNDLIASGKAGNYFDLIGGINNDEELKDFLKDLFNNRGDKNLNSFANNVNYKYRYSGKKDNISKSPYYKRKLQELKHLKEELNFFVSREMYEQAAGVRDKIKEVNKDLMNYRKEKEKESEI